MRLPFFAFPAAFLAIAELGLLTGCGTSEGTGDASGGGILPCKETPKAVGPSDTTPLGFSAEDVLATVGGMHQSGLTWVMGADLYATHARAGMQTNVTFALNGAMASVTFVESTGGGCPGPESDAPCVVCQSRFEISLPLDVSTADGALAESMNVTLTTSSKTTASFTVDVPAATLKGAYFTQITPKAGDEVSGLHLTGGWGESFPGSAMVVPNAWNGFVAAVIRPVGAPTGGAFAAHGYFPPETKQ